MNAYSILPYWITLLWLLGYVEYIVTVCLGPHEKTLGLSLIVALVVASRFVVRQKYRVPKIQAPIWFWGVLAICVLMFLISIWQGFYPPHHPQEYDAINYSMGLARQHLLAGTFNHLRWSAADLWPSALQWGFAPIWFMGKNFNKLPQVLAAVFGFILMIDIGRTLLPNTYLSYIPALAFYTTQGVMIQLGTAQFDLTQLCFLLAFLHGYVKKTGLFWMALNLALFSTAKSFSLGQVFLVAGIIIFIEYFQNPNRLFLAIKGSKKLILFFGIFSSMLLARSTFVSLDRAGTPFSPIKNCLLNKLGGCQSESGEAIRNSGDCHMKTRDAYGLGRGIKSFFIHLWAISVPSKGVNNEWDYPLGLGWLIMIVLLIFQIPDWIKSLNVPILPVISFSFWLVWWMTSQQSRWLYPAMALGWLAALPILNRVKSRVLGSLLVISASLSLVSEVRAFRSDFGKTPSQVQETQEIQWKMQSPNGIVKKKESLFVNGAITGVQLPYPEPCWILEH